MLDQEDKNDQKKNIGQNAETRRIPKSLIEEQIKREKEKTLNNEKSAKADTQPLIPPDVPEEEKKDISKTTVINKNELKTEKPEKSEQPSENISIDKTQSISLDKTKTIQMPPPAEEKTTKPDMPINSNLNFPKPPKKKNITPWIIIIIIIIAATIIFYSIRPKKDETEPIKNQRNINNIANKIEDENISEENISTENVDEKQITNTKKIKKVKPVLLKKIDTVKTIELTNENLSGESQKKIRKKGALTSEENDPKIVAITEALIKRLELTSRIRSSKSKRIISKKWRGSFRGFRIDGQRRIKDDKVLSDRIVLVTPSKGRIGIVDGTLNSIQKIKYESFIEELSKSGITIIENEPPDENSVSINLEVSPPKNALSKKDFLISSSGVFGIKGGDGTEKIKLNLPEDFRVIKKTIDVDEKTSYNIHKVHDKKFQPLFFVKEWDKKIEKVEIISTRFKSKEGIGLNSSLGLLRIYYPVLKIARTKDNLIIVNNEDISGYYIIDLTVEDFNNLNIKDSSKIIKIVLE